MNFALNEADIDSIIESVGQTIAKAEALAKSGAKSIPAPKENGGQMRKDAPAESDDKEDSSPAPSDAPADASDAPADDAAAAAPAADAGAQADPAAADAPAADAAPADADAQDPAAEGAEDHISDEELHEVYASMPEDELERHYMILRSILQEKYAAGGADAGAAAPAADAAAAPAAAPAAPAEAMKSEDKSMDKAEKEKLEGLEKSNSELRKQIELLTKAIEVGFKPQRKSVAGIEFVRKSEADQAPAAAGNGAQDFSKMSKSEITVALNEKCKDATLGKAERQAINDYLLYNEGREKVEAILGGKK